jgi:ribonuclease R
MEFSVPQLFEHFLSSTLAESIALDTLKQSLLITTPTQEEELEIALDGLTRVGFLEATLDPPTYSRRPDETLVLGRLRCSSKGFCFAIRDEPGVEDIYIHASNLNGAWNGDQVIARITKEGVGRRSPEGEVAAVVERANPTLVGRIKKSLSGLRAVPLDDRLLFELDLELPPDEDPEALEGKFAYIEVLRYPLGNLLPVGKIRKVLGNSPETSMDIDLVCCKYNLPQSFSPEITELAEASVPKIQKTEIKKRQDYRDWLTITIEPLDLQHPHSLQPNAAISLAEVDEGWQLGVHITDVAHWVEEGSLLDREAQNRGSAVFLDAAVFPLFPPKLEAHFALVAQQERLTLSVLLYVDREGHLQSFEIHPSVIVSKAHLSYGQVQSLLASATEELSAENSELLSLLRHLQEITHHLRQQRHQIGGFDFPMLDLSMPTSGDESRQGSLVISSSLIAHGMMSEIFWLANKAVGEHLFHLRVPALYWIQPAPPVEALQGFLRLTSNMRLELSLSDPTQVQREDFQRFSRRILAPDVVENGSSPALCAQLLSTLVPASYVLQEYPDDLTEIPAREIHFGLGLPTPYCHITSPLHSYADLVNQRALHLLFEKGRDRKTARNKKSVDLGSSACYEEINWQVLPPKVQEEWLTHLHHLVDPLNQRQQVVTQAEQELIGLKKSEFMQKHIGETFPGLIIGVQNYGFFVQIDPILAEGLVHVSSLKTDWYEYRSRQQSLVGRKSRRQFRLGDRVDVQIKNVDYYRQQIDLVVVSEGRFYEEEDF